MCVCVCWGVGVQKVCRIELYTSSSYWFLTPSQISRSYKGETFCISINPFFFIGRRGGGGFPEISCLIHHYLRCHAYILSP